MAENKQNPRVDPGSINTDLLYRIADQCMKTPYRVRMRVWSCGTSACVAGWAVWLSDRCENAVLGMNCLDRAQKLLGLTYDQAKRLFHTYHWPPDMFFRWDNCENGEGNIVAERIKRFIDTEGRE